MKTLLPVFISMLLLSSCNTTDTIQTPKSEKHPAVQLPNGFVVATDHDHPPLALQKPDAVIPEEAKARGVHGQVSAAVTVNTEGRVTNVEIISSPDESLTIASKVALQKWFFIPAVQSGQIVSGKVVVKFSFEAK